ALFRLADDLLQLLVQHFVAAAPVDVGMRLWEEEGQEQFEVTVQHFLPRTVIVGHPSRSCLASLVCPLCNRPMVEYGGIVACLLTITETRVAGTVFRRAGQLLHQRTAVPGAAPARRFPVGNVVTHAYRFGRSRLKKRAQELSGFAQRDESCRFGLVM